MNEHDDPKLPPASHLPDDDRPDDPERRRVLTGLATAPRAARRAAQPTRASTPPCTIRSSGSS